MSNETVHWFNVNGVVWGVKDVDNKYSLVNSEGKDHEDNELLNKLSEMVGEGEE